MSERSNSIFDSPNAHPEHDRKIAFLGDLLRCQYPRVYIFNRKENFQNEEALILVRDGKVVLQTFGGEILYESKITDPKDQPIPLEIYLISKEEQKILNFLNCLSADRNDRLKDILEKDPSLAKMLMQDARVKIAVRRKKIQLQGLMARGTTPNELDPDSILKGTCESYLQMLEKYFPDN